MCMSSTVQYADWLWPEKKSLPRTYFACLSPDSGNMIPVVLASANLSVARPRSARMT